MNRLTPLMLFLALAGPASPALAEGAGARATSGHAALALDGDAWQLQLPLNREVSLGAWPKVDHFESLDGTEQMVRLQAGVGLRYARSGFSFGAEAQTRVTDLGSLPGAGALDDHQLMARFRFDL